MNDWIEIKQKGKLPEPYKFVIVKDSEDTAEYKSYMYPNGDWAWRKSPKYWKEILENKLN